MCRTKRNSRNEHLPTQIGATISARISRDARAQSAEPDFLERQPQEPADAADDDATTGSRTPDWVTGDEPMTGAQKSYLKTLSEEAHEPDAFDPALDKAERPSASTISRRSAGGRRAASGSAGRAVLRGPGRRAVAGRQRRRRGRQAERARGETVPRGEGEAEDAHGDFVAAHDLGGLELSSGSRPGRPKRDGPVQSVGPAQKAPLHAGCDSPIPAPMAKIRRQPRAAAREGAGGAGAATSGEDRQRDAGVVGNALLQAEFAGQHAQHVLDEQRARMAARATSGQQRCVRGRRVGKPLPRSRLACFRS